MRMEPLPGIQTSADPISSPSERVTMRLAHVDPLESRPQLCLVLFIGWSIFFGHCQRHWRIFRPIIQIWIRRATSGIITGRIFGCFVYSGGFFFLLFFSNELKARGCFFFSSGALRGEIAIWAGRVTASGTRNIVNLLIDNNEIRDGPWYRAIGRPIWLRSRNAGRGDITPLRPRPPLTDYRKPIRKYPINLQVITDGNYSR